MQERYPNVKTVHLISHQNWHRDELATSGEWTVDYSHGLDVPAYEQKDAWWLPQAQAVQLLRAVEHHGLPELTFTAPAPYLLDTVPSELLGRRVETMTAEEAVSTLFEWPTLWWKMATAKNDLFLAKERDHAELLNLVQALELPTTAILQSSTALPEIISEYRFFVAKKKHEYLILASSGYLHKGVSVYDGAVFEEKEEEKAAEVVEQLFDADIDLPPSFVVDVAVTVDGAFILEFNPSWCSGWYACEIDGVLTTIERGFRVTPREYKAWAYNPDPVLLQKFANPGRRIWGTS